MTGFYRSNHPDNTSDLISLLERARCCASVPEFSDQRERCEFALWGDFMNTCV